MKISTTINKNYIACFDEARGLAINKRRIIKKRINNSISYLQYMLLIFIILLIFSQLFCLLNRYIISSIFYVGAFLFFLFEVIKVMEIYRIRKSQGFNNTIKIDKNGITDESYYGIKMQFKWDKVLAVVFGKHTVTILTDTPVYFYFSIDEKDNIKKVLDKYGIRDKVIE